MTLTAVQIGLVSSCIFPHCYQTSLTTSKDIAAHDCRLLSNLKDKSTEASVRLESKIARTNDKVKMLLNHGNTVSVTLKAFRAKFRNVGSLYKKFAKKVK